jgi:hypothetical protein
VKDAIAIISVCPSEIGGHLWDNKTADLLEFDTFSLTSHEFKHRQDLCWRFQRVGYDIVRLRTLSVDIENDRRNHNDQNDRANDDDQRWQWSGEPLMIWSILKIWQIPQFASEVMMKLLYVCRVVLVIAHHLKSASRTFESGTFPRLAIVPRISGQ